MRQTTGWLPVVALVLSASLMCGCSSEGKKKRPPVAKVKGVITFKGEPVSGATVSFVMEDAPRNGSGITDVDGNFQLTTFFTDDGAIVGTHKVTVVKVTPGTNNQPVLDANGIIKDYPPAPPIDKVIPGIYGDPKTTPLTFTVDPGENEAPIELKE